MKIFLIILTVLICFLCLICFSPVELDYSYCKENFIKIKFFGITLYDNHKPKKSGKNNVEPNENKPKNKDDNLFVKTYRRKGFADTVKYFGETAVLILKKLCFVIKRLKIKKIKLDVTVATDNAAKTAAYYGTVCGAVYPAFALIKSYTDFKTENIKVNSDFNKSKFEIATEFCITARLFWLLTAAILLLKEYYKLKRKDSENQ